MLSAEEHFGNEGSNWAHVSEVDKARVIEQYGSLATACEHYACEDAARLRDFREGAWWFESCRAEAEVRYELNDGSFRIERLCSGGLFGIESDCGEEYRDSVEHDELADLNLHLERFGIQRIELGTATEA
jgi:hypothetical protein